MAGRFWDDRERREKLLQVLLSTLVIVGVVALLFLAWRVRESILLVFASVIVAALLLATAAPIRRLTRLPQQWSLTLAGVGMVVTLALVFWLIGSQVTRQVTELLSRLPQSIERLEQGLGVPIFGVSNPNRTADDDRSGPRPPGATLSEAARAAVTAPGQGSGADPAAAAGPQRNQAAPRTAQPAEQTQPGETAPRLGEAGRAAPSGQESRPAAGTGEGGRDSRSASGTGTADQGGEGGILQNLPVDVETARTVAERLASYGISLFNGITGVILVIVGGFFFAADPQLYRRGLVKLFPKAQHERVEGALDDCGRALHLWLLGTLLSMSIVGALVGLGTWAIGLPAPLALGLFAALTEFVPIVGPIMGAVPALLLALTKGTSAFLWTLLLFVAVQQIESNFITPIVQRRMAELPPALLLFTVVAFGSLFGLIGTVVAAPLTVVLYVLVKKLYVRETLGEATPIPGEHQDKQSESAG